MTDHPNGLQWALIELRDGRRYHVLRDALKDDTGRRINVSYDEVAALAEKWGCELPTPEVLDARWEAAWLQNRPHTQHLWKARGGTPANRTHDDGAVHSEEVDEDIAYHQTKVDGPPGIVGNVGKHWVQTPPGERKRLYGWHVPRGQDWGLPVHPSESDETDARIVQRSRDTSHGGNHVDYGMTVMLMKAERVMVDMTLPPDSIPDTDPAPPSDPRPGFAEPVNAVIPARHFTRAERDLDSVLWLVLHSTENPIADGVARNVARWFGGPSSPQASAHFVVGPEETIQGVALEHVAWAAPGANRNGVQIEMVGQAAKTDWLRDSIDTRSGYPVLCRAARLCAALCDELGLPVAQLGPEELLAGRRGITTHDTVRRAIALAKERGHKAAPWWRTDRGRWARTTHVDPGMQGDRRWPWERFWSWCGRVRTMIPFQAWR